MSSALTPTATGRVAGRAGAERGGALFGAFFFIPGVGHVALGGYILYLLSTGVIGAITAALSAVGVPDDAVIRYETAIKADKPLLIAHCTRIDIERAREVIVDDPIHSRTMTTPSPTRWLGGRWCWN